MDKGKLCFYAPLCNFIRDLTLRTFGEGEKVSDGRISVSHQLSKNQARRALYGNKRDHLFSGGKCLRVGRERKNSET